MNKNKLDYSFSKMLEELIYYNHINRQYHIESKSLISNHQWIHEFCTIKIDIGRQVGKTKFILDHCQPNDCVVVPNFSSMYTHKTMVMANNSIPCNYFTDGQIKDLMGASSIYKPEFVWADESKISKDLLIRNFARSNMTQTFVILGD
jgi:hypothetical protein